MERLLLTLALIIFACHGAATEEYEHRLGWPIHVVNCKGAYQLATKPDDLAHYTCIVTGSKRLYNVPRDFAQQLIKRVNSATTVDTFSKIYHETVAQDPVARNLTLMPIALLVTVMKTEGETFFTLCTPTLSQGFFSNRKGRFSFTKGSDGTFGVQRSAITPKHPKKATSGLIAAPPKPAAPPFVESKPEPFLFFDAKNEYEWWRGETTIFDPNDPTADADIVIDIKSTGTTAPLLCEGDCSIL